MLPEPRTDEQLVQDYLNGDTKAFALLVQRYEPRLLRFSWRWIRDYRVSEDIVQEVFVAVWRDLRRFDPKYKFSSWIYSICKARCIDEIRKITRRPTSISMPDEETWLVVEPSTMDDIDEVDSQKFKSAVMNHLDENERLLYELKIVKKQTYEEIARHAAFDGVKVEALMKRFSRLCEKTRGFVKEKGYNKRKEK